MSVVSIRDVSKAFRGHLLFDSLSFDIEKGRTYALTGPNGSGKSVLLKLICGFVQPDAGEIRVDPAYMSADRVYPDRFGVMIDGPAYLPNLTAERNLLELAAIRNQIGLAEIRDMLVKVGLSTDSKKKVRTFSMGMKQKLSIAQALMESPEVLILDEPFNALDEESVLRTKSIFREEQSKGTTILFTSHNRSDVADLCDEVLEITGANVRKT